MKSLIAIFIVLLLGISIFTAMVTRLNNEDLQGERAEMAMIE